MKKVVLIVSLLFVASSALVFAHGGATGVVKERMDLMDSLQDAMKNLKSLFRGKEEYDVKKVKQNALAIRDGAGKHMTKLFPEGSLKMPSEATPEIWTQWEEFQRLADNLERLGQALHDGAENNQTTGPNTMGSNAMGGPGMMGQNHMMESGMMGQGRMMGGGRGAMHGLDNMTNEQLAAMPAAGLFRMIGQSCAACHKQYRVEK
ncbi:MAG: cytochrome c [Gammaproteobacteria bacterium]|nr:cytochrome c [Gammaproteobacteria bacterium]